ncbi:universal stress protein [Salinibacter sp. 10B]|uniref:universal stress protein n=1 Tax=Salinibacter sp. 10B TaxID=1923971 RepID=UPI000CF3D56C|nr:universal stress protein [Salinibacter sp. 10B]PQJ33743.1 universal stress protein [Salinibacter sp. 10B]
MTLNIDTILFPTDFSDVAEGAFAHAAHLALRYHATIHVFNVVAPDGGDTSNPMDFLPVEPAADTDADEPAAQHVEVQTATQERGTVPVVYTQTDSTSPSEAIINYADEKDMDLVVMGTHGRKGMDRLLSGSVSEEVVRGAPCPVFTVLPSADEGSVPTISRVLAPVDLSEQSDMVVHHAAALSDAYAAPLDLLHVVEEAAYPSAYGLDPLTPSLPNVQDRAREALETLAGRLDLRTDPVNVHVLAGYAARDIVEFAQEHEVDLIVMATHGRTGLDRFLIGSVAEKVVRRAPCPVFTLKSFGKSLLPESETQESE